MPASTKALPAIKVVPATKERWGDIEALFGNNGGYAGCWCMFWRLDRSDFKKIKGDGTKATLKGMTETGKPQVPGLLAYDGKQVIGWCSIGPREGYTALENSRILKRVDDAPVWSIVCFFISKAARGQGTMTALLDGAITYARKKGAKIIEGYPLDMQTPKLAGQKLNSYAGYMGIASIYRAAGFVEVGKASETQLIMRYSIK